MVNTGISPHINQAVSLRNNDLDIIKGLLVFIMVLYHCASMAVSKSPNLSEIFDSISFIHFAFLIITGFLCGWYYAPKLNSVSNVSIKKRLRIRALKILVILIFLNLLFYSFGILNSNKLLSATATLNDLCRNLLISPKGSLLAFEILLPIGFFLFFASFILSKKYILAVSAVFTGITLFLGLWSNIFSTIAFGGIGLMAGVLAQSAWVKKIWTFNQQKAINTFFIFLCCVFSVIIMKHFSPVLRPAFPTFHFYYAIETFFWFLGLLAMIKLINSDFLSDACVFLGNYTLLGYISQMFIIRLIYMLLNKMGLTGYYYYLANVLISTILLFLFLKIVAYSRSRFMRFNSAYRFVFQ